MNVPDPGWRGNKKSATISGNEEEEEVAGHNFFARLDMG